MKPNHMLASSTFDRTINPLIAHQFGTSQRHEISFSLGVKKPQWSDAQQDFSGTKERERLSVARHHASPSRPRLHSNAHHVQSPSATSNNNNIRTLNSASHASVSVALGAERSRHAQRPMSSSLATPAVQTMVRRAQSAHQFAPPANPDLFLKPNTPLLEGANLNTYLNTRNPSAPRSKNDWKPNRESKVSERLEQ